MEVYKNRDGRIVSDPRVCGGTPVFKGTRVTVRTVIASLASGDSVEDILAGFPTLTAEDVRAAMAELEDQPRSGGRT